METINIKVPTAVAKNKELRNFIQSLIMSSFCHCGKLVNGAYELLSEELGNKEVVENDYFICEGCGSHICNTCAETRENSKGEMICGKCDAVVKAL